VNAIPTIIASVVGFLVLAAIAAVFLFFILGMLVVFFSVLL